MKKKINRAAILTMALIIALSGCGKAEERSENFFTNTFKGNFFEIDYPDGLTPAYALDGATFTGDFDVKVTGFRQVAAREGQMPADTDKLSELGITLGNFETDKINGHTAFIADSKSFIAAIFPLDGSVVVVIIAANSENPSFGMNAEKMLKSFTITNESAIPGKKDPVKDSKTASDSKTEIFEEKSTKQDKTETKKTETKNIEASKPVLIDTSGLREGTFYNSDFVFLKLRPGFIVNNSTKTSANISGRVGDMSKQQQINFFFSPPSGVSSAEYAYKYAGGKKPVPVSLGSNILQSVVTNASNGGKITLLFYCTNTYTCKIVITGTMQLTGEVSEILSSIIFK